MKRKQAEYKPDEYAIVFIGPWESRRDGIQSNGGGIGLVKMYHVVAFKTGQKIIYIAPIKG